MTNERLRGAMAAAHVSVEGAADKLGVDPKTVQRWINGRVPHRRHRWSLAEALREEESYLWPAAEAATIGSDDVTGEVVAAYAHRIDLPLSTWRHLIQHATSRIDILGYAVLFLIEQNPDLVAQLQHKAVRGGCQVRIAVGDPESLHVRERDVEEGMEGGIPARIRSSLRYLRSLMNDPAVEVRVYSAPLYNSIFRFDDQMLVTPHLYATPGHSAPLLHLRRLGPGGIFETFQEHFEGIWRVAMAPSLAAPAENALAGA
jgi:transcriptional regulator with XRE-family HTH domain